VVRLAINQPEESPERDLSTQTWVASVALNVSIACTTNAENFLLVVNAPTSNPVAKEWLVPLKSSALLPPIVLVPLIGWLFATSCVSVRPLPLLSRHEETPVAIVRVEASEASYHATRPGNAFGLNPPAARGLNSLAFMGMGSAIL
jgi:hypothetical protein